jgi:hypothetical protein
MINTKKLSSINDYRFIIFNLDTGKRGEISLPSFITRRTIVLPGSSATVSLVGN